MAESAGWRPSTPLGAVPDRPAAPAEAGPAPEPGPGSEPAPTPVPPPAPPGPPSSRPWAPRSERPARRLPRKLWLLVCLLGVFVAVVFIVLPVGVNFADDPLLRLRDLNPELSPPAPTASCGSAIASLDVHPRDTTLFELARANACERAARRRVFGSVAAGAIVVVAGLTGLAAGRARS